MRARALALALVLAAFLPAAAEDGVPIAVIVHPEQSATLSLEDLAQIYLRRRRFWADGAPVVPLNLSAPAELRRRFSRLVLREKESVIADYWNRRYFQGVLPPATLASTEAVRRYVASDPKAIGYVPAAEVDGSVRVLFHLE